MNNFMERAMIPLMKSVRRMEQWSYSPAGSSASSGDKSQKYVGLRNLGCICYMNSMMQQFFMIPAFRYNLLCVDDMIKEDIKEYKGAKIDDNMLHQLQKLMAHLELSERSDYNPFEFCFAFKEMDGNPTNTGEQKDCQEFLNLAFDRIENQLKATSRKYLLQSVFGGQTCSQLVCQECGKVKNRIEDFYNLSLTVKDIKSMHESLQKLVEGEVINDYQCDGCGKKVDVSKRTLISQTPNVLIVHLQRIVFNFDSFKNDKLNSYFEFPYQLDLKPYSFYEVMKKENRIKDPKEGEEDEEGGAKEEQKEEAKDQDNQWPAEEECYEYKLVGTTVHSGTANAGHYWSYINTKRGYLEPGQDDPNWNKTENDQWMEFNDSRVSEFSFEKLKDECFGDKQKSGGGSGYDDSGWSSWGSYGKSAYMLVYERRKKRPIKVVVTEEEAKVEGEQILHDEAKNEHYKLIDYREGVEDIAPNQIYMQVHDDNKKFEFDNDIYSQEFFEFVKSILQASQKLGTDLKNVENNQDKELMEKVNANSMLVGKKSILDLLAKCFYNQQMKDLVQILISIMKTDDELCVNFMSQCYNEDNFEYLMMTMLDCPDNVTRVNVCLLVKFIITKLKIKEKAILYEMHKEEILCVSTTDQSSYTKTIETPVAMTTRFIQKCLDSLNTLVAKNWSKFDQFLEVLYCFGVGDTEIYTLTNMSEEEKLEQEKIGIEFLFRQQFIGKACDFLLGRKSPLATPNEKRYEMGGSYSNPNFSSIMKLITKMINNEELIKQYPLMDYEKKLFLQYDLLKVMLGQNQGSKQFGLCLANMCKDNLKFSKKVSKIFIKVINSSTYDNVKNYLKALKPFLMMNDSLKGIKMEWIFGFAHIITRKEYREVNYKFGLEIVNKVNDEAYTYLSPIINSHSEEALLAQLLKCKGRLDTFAINCLKEMLSIMAKDDIISRYIYNSTPPTFQYARYSDWIKPYLEQQKSDLERTSSYVYMKSKYDTIIKALQLYAQFEEKCKSYALEEEQVYKQCKEQNVDYLGSEKEWMGYDNEDVLKHYPPQIIIGRQVGEERVMQIYDEHPLVTVTIFDQDNDFMYSNPTGFFNLSIPHVELRTSMYQTMSYVAFKKAMYQNELTAKRVEKEKQLQEERKAKEVEEGEIIDTSKEQSSEDKEDIKEEIKEEGAEESKEESKGEEQKEEVKVEDPVILVKDWYENKKEGPVLMKVHVSNKSQETIKFRVTLRPLETPCNVILPESFMTDTLYQNEYKCIGNFQKIDPSKPWTQVKVEIEAVKKTYGQASGFSNGSAANGTDGIKINVYDSNNIQISDSGEVKLSMNMVSCIKCQHMQRSSNIKCDNCSDILMTGSTYDPQTNLYDNYYSAS